MIGQQYHIIVGLIEFFKKEFKENVPKQKVLNFSFSLEYKNEKNEIMKMTCFYHLFFFYNISFLTYNLINIS